MRKLLLLLAFAISVGCGNDRVATYPVSGEIEFSDGRPVRHGRIEFESVDHGTTASGKIQHDGSFVLGTYTADDGAAEGEHNVIVIQLVIADGAFKHTIDHGRPVPIKYGDYETSQLHQSISAEGENHVSVIIDN